MARLALVSLLLALYGCTGASAPCGDTPSLRAGARCGPCGLDAVSCVGGELRCDGATDCGLGAACAVDTDCETGACHASRCGTPIMAFIPAGSFLMGLPPAERGRIDGEDQHPVRLSRHYLMDATEVTNGAWERLMGRPPSYFAEACGPDCPVENVRWVEALAFANARSEAEGLAPCYDLSRCRGQIGWNYQCEAPIAFDLDCPGYRLPTEAEWEYAYRAGTTTAYFFCELATPNGCDQPALGEVAQFRGNCSVDYGLSYDCSEGGSRPDSPMDCGPTTVARRAPNGWGLYDMAGNVAELTWDTYGAYPAYAEDPTGPSDQTGRIVVRGATFCGHLARLRAADRKQTTWTQRNVGEGFRLVRTYRVARPEERLNDDICDNSCGGCEPLLPSPGVRCGPCQADTYVCDGRHATVCSGATTGCRYGAECHSDDVCVLGHCSNRRCAPDGFAYIPAGAFAMGARPGEPRAESDEPLHDVRLSRPLLMAQHEVTQRDWETVFGRNPAHFVACGPACPVERVNREDALAYCNARSRAEGLPECYDLSGCTGTPGVDFECPLGITFDLSCAGYRLPTESEWEHAYRAGGDSTFHGGEPETLSLCEQPALDSIAQYCGTCEVSYEGSFDCSVTGGSASCGTRPTGGYAANTWTLHDMSGNVAEIVWDLYDRYPEYAVDPTGPADVGQQYVVRGGGFCGHLARLRAAERRAINRVGRVLDVGLRVARSLPPDGSSTGCDNGCGGCRPILPPPGTPCGPCRADTYECDDAATTHCSATTLNCNFGAGCASSSECRNSSCVNGFCVPDGFVVLPPGSFTMGSPPSELGRVANETQHPVTLTRSVLLIRSEVTQREWRALMGTRPFALPDCGSDCPAESITWLDALAYANALSRVEGLPECYDLSACTGTPGVDYACPFEIAWSLECPGYRLASEAEWELAYRAGTQTTFSNGNPSSADQCDQPLLDEQAQYCGNCAESAPGPVMCGISGMDLSCSPVPVRSRAANPWGLYDMAGNVAELVWDVLADYPPSATDPVGPAHSGQPNIIRGGGFCSHYARLRAADRRSITRTARRSDVGFRLARTLP